MKRSWALIILALGLVSMAGSCVPLGYSLYLDVLSEPVATIAIGSSGVSRSDPIRVTPGKLARISVTGEVETTSVQEKKDAGTSYAARFRFPFNYTISDAKGRVLGTGGSVLAWDGPSIITSDQKVDSRRGKLTVKTNLEKFAAPVTGSVLVDLSMMPDETYGAEIHAAQILVYEGLVENTWYVVTGVAMLVLGLVAVMVGFVFVVSGAASAAIPVATSPAGGAVPAAGVSLQRAAWIHLSGFLGYLIPFGNVIAPLVLWMLWRTGDVYVDDAGREAVNFQISVMIYGLISIVAMILIIGFLMLIGVAIFQTAMMIIAAVHSSRGEAFRYPMIMRFIRN